MLIDFLEFLSQKGYTTSASNDIEEKRSEIKVFAIRFVKDGS